ncbi:MAG: DegQ family serine endoprotease [Deltaproteobacteria bacterium]|jgi:serine protease Do|nr:DegQ family serine endoprotease [Deltaproteobacteria bacterium]
MKFIAIKAFVPERKTFIFVTLLAAMILAFSGFYPASGIAAKYSTTFLPPESFSNLAEESGPAVVNIRTVKTIKGGGRVFRHFKKGPFGEDDPMRDFFDRFFDEDQKRDFKQRSLGSGFIIDKDGYIVTNNHVIDNADKIVVILNDEKEFDATIVGRDKNTDLALIKIEAKNDLPVLNFGDSDTLKVGQWVVAIGNPFGLEQTVTAGIVSAKGRVIGSGPYDDFIQTDASINPGNSGGPLIDMDGKVVGINTAIVAGGQGIGFAIPVNLAKNIITQLKSTGEVTRGWLGVGIQDISEEVADYYGIKEKKGVLVTEVFPGDPADSAGITPKDIILSVNGESVDSARELTGLIADTNVGDTIKIKVLRDGKTRTFKIKVAKREDAKISQKSTLKEKQEELGIRVADITPETARRFNLKDTKGVIVVGIDSDSKAAESGLKVQDIIKEVNHQAITSVKDLDKAISEVETGGTVNLFVRRMNRGFLVIKITK